MRFFERPLTPAESHALVDRIEARFEADGFGLWVLERTDDSVFLGFAGLAVQTFEAPFTPCVEVGWRLARHGWGQGYATEAARAALRFGFEVVGLDEIVSFTTPANERSRRVMERLGMTRDPADDFDHPLLPPGERRGLVLIDPPYEAPDEFERAAGALKAAYRRFATGIFMLWFPIKSPAAADAFCGEVLSAGMARALRLDIALPAAGAGKTGAEPGRARMAAAGLLVLNPPYGLDAAMRDAAPILAERLGGGARLDVVWLAGEGS